MSKNNHVIEPFIYNILVVIISTIMISIIEVNYDVNCMTDISVFILMVIVCISLIDLSKHLTKI
jgi:hypothetical protein